MSFLRLSAAFLRKWDAVASDPLHSGHRSPFVIDPDPHMMKLRDAAGVSFCPIGALRAVENGFAAYAPQCQRAPLAPQDPEDSGPLYRR